MVALLPLNRDRVIRRCSGNELPPSRKSIPSRLNRLQTEYFLKNKLHRQRLQALVGNSVILTDIQAQPSRPSESQAQVRPATDNNVRRILRIDTVQRVFFIGRDFLQKSFLKFNHALNIRLCVGRIGKLPQIQCPGKKLVNNRHF